MPIAIVVGSIFYPFFERLSFITPYLIFTMLFFTYCNIELKKIKFSGWQFQLIGIQIVGAMASYWLLRPFNVVLAEGTMICFLAPTGTAAPVITRMLNGDVEGITTYSILCNLMVAILAPVIFSLVGHYKHISFFNAFGTIAEKVMFLLIAPIITALILKRFIPGFRTIATKITNLPFYLWTVALCVVTGRTVGFILRLPQSEHGIELWLAAGAFVACGTQFILGRKTGKRYEKTVAGGQGLGQKNTILAIWMAQTYLTPISSIAPGAYVLWQNIVNSWQVWKMKEK